MSLLAVKGRQSSSIAEAARVPWSGEAVAFCPRCKALQTVWVSDDELIPTRKFFQEEGGIYHDCGSDQPCRLYRTYSMKV